MLLHARFFIIDPEVIVTKEGGFLNDALIYLKPLPSFTLIFLYHTIVLLQALRLNYILDNLRMFQKTSLATGLAYILLTALYPAWNNITPALIANSLIIWLFSITVKFYHTSKPESLIFDTALIAGISILLYHPAIIIILWLFTSLAILRPFKLNEWFIIATGVTIPFYFLAFWLFYNDNIGSFINYLPKFNLHLLYPKNKTGLLLSVCIAAVIILPGIYYQQLYSNRMIIQVRKNWIILLLMLLVMLPCCLLFQGADITTILLCAVPAAAIASNVFIYPESNLFPAFLFWCTVAVIVYNNFIGLKF